MKLYLLVCSLVAAIAVCHGQPRQRYNRDPSYCHMRQIDTCFSPMISLTSQFSDVITTEKGVNKFCSTVSASMVCLKTYLRRCSTLLQREMFNFFSDQFSHRVDEFCNSSTLKRQLLTHSPCIQSQVFSNKQYQSTCVNDLMVAFNTGRDLMMNRLTSSRDIVSTLTSENQVIASDRLLDLSCCGFNRFTNCFQQRVNDSCGRDAVSVIDLFTSRTFGIGMDKICPSKLFNPLNSACTSILPKEGSQSNVGQLNDNPFGKYIMQYLGFLFDQN